MSPRARAPKKRENARETQGTREILDDEEVLTEDEVEERAAAEEAAAAAAAARRAPAEDDEGDVEDEEDEGDELAQRLRAARAALGSTARVVVTIWELFGVGGLRDKRFRAAWRDVSDDDLANLAEKLQTAFPEGGRFRVDARLGGRWILHDADITVHGPALELGPSPYVRPVHAPAPPPTPPGPSPADERLARLEAALVEERKAREEERAQRAREKELEKVEAEREREREARRTLERELAAVQNELKLLAARKPEVVAPAGPAPELVKLEAQLEALRAESRKREERDAQAREERLTVRIAELEAAIKKASKGAQEDGSVFAHVLRDYYALRELRKEAKDEGDEELDGALKEGVRLVKRTLSKVFNPKFDASDDTPKETAGLGGNADGESIEGIALWVRDLTGDTRRAQDPSFVARAAQKYPKFMEAFCAADSRSTLSAALARSLGPDASKQVEDMDEPLLAGSLALVREVAKTARASRPAPSNGATAPQASGAVASS